MSVMKTTAVALVALSLAGCANTPGGGGISPQAQQALGAAAGGIAGGFLGSQFGEGSGNTAATIAGALAGAAIGGLLTNGLLTQQDTAVAQNTAQAAVNTSQPQTWQSQNGQVTGQVVPQNTFQAADGRYCRNYKQTIYVEGEQYETATGTACQQPDGTWRIVS